MASKYTSFVGVDKKTRKSVYDSAMITREVRQEIPLGFGSFNFFGDDQLCCVDDAEEVLG